MDYSFGNFKFLVREVPPITRGKLTPERAKRADKDELSIASYNVENLDAVNDAERMPAIARQIINNLRSPDILALNEMQDNDGEGPGGPAGDQTWQALVDAISAEGGPDYEYRQIDPVITPTAARRTPTSASASCSTRRGSSSSTARAVPPSRRPRTTPRSRARS